MPNQRQLRDITDNDAYYSSKLLGNLVKKIAANKSKYDKAQEITRTKFSH